MSCLRFVPRDLFLSSKAPSSEKIIQVVIHDLHVTSTHWGGHLCPQVLQHCPAFVRVTRVTFGDLGYVWDAHLVSWCSQCSCSMVVFHG